MIGEVEPHRAGARRDGELLGHALQRKGETLQALQAEDPPGALRGAASRRDPRGTRCLRRRRDSSRASFGRIPRPVRRAPAAPSARGNCRPATCSRRKRGGRRASRAPRRRTRTGRLASGALLAPTCPPTRFASKNCSCASGSCASSRLHADQGTERVPARTQDARRAARRGGGGRAAAARAYLPLVAWTRTEMRSGQPRHRLEALLDRAHLRGR